MIKYVPFLKSKSNEINAISSLSSSVRASICPFFDFHKKIGGYSAQEFIDSVAKTLKSFRKHLVGIDEFYFDNYDIDENIVVQGEHNYLFLLKNLTSLPVIPVVAIDRSEKHIEAVVDLKEKETIKSNCVAFRITPEDFEDFAAVADEIDEILSKILAQFESVDLIFDCRMCRNLNPKVLGQQILDFSATFCSSYPTRRVIVTGSSIPASIGDLLRVNHELILDRTEISIFRYVQPLHNHHQNLLFGDYATVSPNYSDSDIPPEMLQNVMTAKFTYSFSDKHYFIRGAGLKTNGRRQYFQMAHALCQKNFFRGENFSSGDEYLAQKSRAEGGNCGPNTVIKPAIVSHITFISALNVI